MNKEMQEDIKEVYRKLDNLKKEMINLGNKVAKKIDDFQRKINEQLINEQEWKPKYGHSYYSFDAFYNVVEKDWMNDLLDQARMNMNIVFATEQIAEFEVEKRKVKAELERYALEHNDPDLEEWNNIYEHFCIRLAIKSTQLEIGSFRNFKIESVTYFTSEKIVKDAIKAIGEKRIIKYLFGIENKEEPEC